MLRNALALNEWAPLNDLTRMVTVNGGDSNPLARAEAELPGAAWMGIRILVAFESQSGRPMHMSYVLIGRDRDGDEFVALFNEKARMVDTIEIFSGWHQS